MSVLMCFIKFCKQVDKNVINIQLILKITNKNNTNKQTLKFAIHFTNNAIKQLVTSQSYDTQINTNERNAMEIMSLYKP